jgi:CrcB protein
MPVMDRRELGAIFAGGFVGALARAGLSRALVNAPDHWPWATFTVNIAGALMLGWFATWLHEHRPPDDYRRPFLATGFCGALTTFSTMQLELLRMIDRGDWGLACGYAAASVAAGLAAVHLATTLLRRARQAA